VVNGEQVGLDYELKNGDIVRIITSSGGEPRHDWLRLVQSSHAKSKVRHFLREKSKQENVAVGSERLQRAMARLTAAQREAVADADKDDLARHFDYQDRDGLLAAIGYGAVEAQTVIDHILERDAKPDSLVEEAHMLLPVGLRSEQRSSRQAPLPVSAGGVDGFHSRISKCCNPLPGDDIRGYITRGSGLTIHRADCKNLAYHAQREPERIVELKWSDDDRSASFRQDIEVIAVDRLGLLSHITAIISDADINIATASAEKTAPHLARLQLTLEISRRRDLEHVIERIHQLIDVVEVRRLGTDPTAAT
jgi:GTP diphosphokinase / guanosine-3',5'-bis(diphosphate) 3'-diphosphatase